MTREEFIQRAVIAMLGNPKLMTKHSSDTTCELIKTAQTVADQMEAVPIDFEYESILDDIARNIEGVYQSIDDLHQTYKINS